MDKHPDCKRACQMAVQYDMPGHTCPTRCDFLRYNGNPLNTPPTAQEKQRVKHWRSEELLEAVRVAPNGTRRHAEAWVAYMRHAKMKSEPRRLFADMMRRHLRWPLGTEVWVKTPDAYLRGSINKHWREYPHRCTVQFEVAVNYDGHGERFAHLIPFRSIKPVRKP